MTEAPAKLPDATQTGDPTPQTPGQTGDASVQVTIPAPTDGKQGIATPPPGYPAYAAPQIFAPQYGQGPPPGGAYAAYPPPHGQPPFGQPPYGQPLYGGGQPPHGPPPYGPPPYGPPPPGTAYVVQVQVDPVMIERAKEERAYRFGMMSLLFGICFPFFLLFGMVGPLMMSRGKKAKMIAAVNGGLLLMYILAVVISVSVVYG